MSSPSAQGTLKSLKAVHHELSDPLVQIQTLSETARQLPRFERGWMKSVSIPSGPLRSRFSKSMSGKCVI